MNILYFRESKEYCLNKYLELQKENDEILNKLVDCNILILKEQSIRFNFVGMIVLNNCMVIIFPKYKKDPKLYYTKDEKENYTKILFKVFGKYNQNKAYLLENDCLEEEEYFNLFTLYKSLINDYIEYGFYENESHIHVINGDGEIDWDKTIDELDNNFNILKNPIYLNYYTHDIEEEQENYIRNIQKKLLTDAAIYFEGFRKFGLEEFQFDFHFDNDVLGEKDYQIFKIDLELRETFSERKINLLKLMKSILKEKKHDLIENINIYGTKSYCFIWEDICQNVFGHNPVLKKKIPKPNWRSIIGEKDNYSSSFIPDIVFEKDNDLYIYDAKYYETDFDDEGNLKNNSPGIGDISKQFLYEECYRLYYQNNGVKKDNYYNAFLFPVEESDYKYIGNVFFELFPEKKIDLFKLSTNMMYENYLKNLKIDLKIDKCKY